jgi:hypothetical protein
MVLYEDADVVVTASDHGSARAIVTFSSLNEHERGFGRALLDKEGVTAVYFVARWNHWFQPQGCRAALPAVRAFLNRAGIVGIMTYGSSMGGFAACLFSGRLNADRVLMLGPQFTSDPAKPPYEQRWVREAGEVTYEDDDMVLSASPSAKKLVVYDPYEDRVQAELFVQLPNTHLFPIAFSGHNVSHFLLQTELLQSLVLQSHEARFVATEFRRAVRGQRSKAGNYWHRLGVRTRGRGDGQLSLKSLSKAWQLRPKDVAIGIDYANALIAAARFADARDVFALVAELLPGHSAPLRGLSVTSRELGEHRRAVSYGRAAVQIQSSPDLLRVLASALIEAGKWDESSMILDELDSRDPDNAANEKLRYLFDERRIAAAI